MKKDKIHDWHKLDNAAKIFPFTTNKRDTKCFRFVCELKEYVSQKELQTAVEAALEDFPLYRCVLKRGLFWYYLEESDIEPVVIKENSELCAPLYKKESENLLFRVNYYRKRINLEVYHALSDGLGAAEFFKCVLSNYLSLIKKEVNLKNIDLNFKASLAEKIDNSFKKYYDSEGHKKKVKISNAYKVRGRKYSEGRIEGIEGVVSTKELLTLARSKNTTITGLLTAIYYRAIYDEMSIKDRKKKVNMALPINLRPYFNSMSVRNFFGVFNIPYDFRKNSAEIDDIIEYMNLFLKENLNYERTSAIINSYMALESNVLIRAIPLFIKDFLLWVYDLLLDQRIVTTSFSNLGKMEIPEALHKHIDNFIVHTSTNRLQITTISYLDNFSISFTSIFKNTNIIRNFFGYLTKMGLEVKVATNMIDGDEDE